MDRVVDIVEISTGDDTETDWECIPFYYFINSKYANANPSVGNYYHYHYHYNIYFLAIFCEFKKQTKAQFLRICPSHFHEIRSNSKIGE